METAAVRPPVDTDRVSENFCCFYLLYSSVCRHRGRHRNPVFCMYLNVCQKMSKDCLCLFPKQIQMYVVVGLQFWCHGLYCLSLCGGIGLWGSGWHDWDKSETPDTHTQTHACAGQTFPHNKPLRADTVLISQICQQRTVYMGDDWCFILTPLFCFTKNLSTAASMLNIFLFQKYTNRTNIVQ